MSWKTIPCWLILPLVLCVLASCGRKKDWDEEILVQVFKPKGVNVGTVTVTATQGGKTDEATVDGFSSCDANRVRIIPQQGVSSELTLTATASVGGLSPVTKKVTPPTKEVQLVLGTGALEPAGTCTPSGPVPDTGPPKNATGLPCSLDGQCQGGRCVTQMQSLGSKIAFPGGYCSQDCSSSGTPCNAATEACLDSTDGNDTVIAQNCIKTCTSGGDCRSDYTCTPGNLCMPK